MLHNVVLFIEGVELISSESPSPVCSQFLDSIPWLLLHHGFELLKHFIVLQLLFNVVDPAYETMIIYKQVVLQEFHSTPLGGGGHAGSLRTFNRLAAQFYWPGMLADIKKFVKACLICQQAKSTNTHPGGSLQPHPIPQQVWKDVSMDFILHYLSLKASQLSLLW